MLTFHTETEHSPILSANHRPRSSFDQQKTQPTTNVTDTTERCVITLYRFLSAVGKHFCRILSRFQGLYRTSAVRKAVWTKT